MTGNRTRQAVVGALVVVVIVLIAYLIYEEYSRSDSALVSANGARAPGRCAESDSQACMIEKVYQVFVSSTYADLADERRRVSETLAKAGFISAGMELFPATDQQQLSFIQRVIDRCDYYVVIIGGRYGSLA